MKITYYENVTREVTIDLEPNEEQMEIWEIDSDDIIRQRVFEEVGFCGWDAEEVTENGWEVDKYV